eukprot:TRINITY_DN23830_c0_g1_i1.p1 TRINITY_DN23830_c0_g1~~TRINITY_DN23830_c0_g1_i1.p1  ORF type:complete len:575 (-),score=77.13 TRINITY_DN23830_c0_g1_i1:83-1807(-)
MMLPQAAFSPSGGRRDFGLKGDRFQFIRALQKGGQGEVHICRRISTGNEYAVKIIAGRVLRKNKESEVFLRREIRCLRELQHRNIVNLLAAFWEAGSCFIVMDLAREGDLSDRIDGCSGLGRDAANSDCAARYVAHQLLAGLGYMHQRRVIHRDLKLENCLISAAAPAPEPMTCLLFEIKITDFGLSTWLDIENESMTPVGTPNYFAPEVHNSDYDTRIDFYSLGVVLYVMLCGNFPFQGTEQANSQTLVESYAWDCVSEEGKDIVLGLLETNPDQRLSHTGCSVHAWITGAPYVPEISLVVEEADELELDDCRNFSGMAAEAGTIQYITGWTGSATDCIGIGWRSGDISVFGTEAGYQRSTVHLEPGETVIAVAQETRVTEGPRYLGNSVVFYTSHCNVIAFQGDEAVGRGRFVAPADCQIVGLQFQGHYLTGIHLAPLIDGAGAVAWLGGRVGSAVDEVLIQLREGPLRRYGRQSGQPVEPYSLQAHERIMVVEQSRRDAHLGSSITFYTSTGATYKLFGVESTTSRRFVAPASRQVCSLEFNEGLLWSVGTCESSKACPGPGDVTYHAVSE